MLAFKYKIIEFQPNDKMEKTFNDLGKEGWELVSVTPIGLFVKGDSDSSFGGVGSGELEGKFDNIAAYFKKVVEKK